MSRIDSWKQIMEKFNNLLYKENLKMLKLKFQRDIHGCLCNIGRKQTKLAINSLNGVINLINLYNGVIKPNP